VSRLLGNLASLAPLYPDNQTSAEPFGRAWLSTCSCRIANRGVHWNHAADALAAKFPAEWPRQRRSAHPAISPLLAKFSFSDRQLPSGSPPTTPTPPNTKKLGRGGVADGVWHIGLRLKPECISSVGGTKALRTTKDAFPLALENHTLENFSAARDAGLLPGDTFFSLFRPEPRTPSAQNMVPSSRHRIFRNSLSGLRLYGRVDSFCKPRELHLEKSLAVTNFLRPES